MNKKIVLIDDDADILDVMQYVLTDEGYNVAAYDHLERLEEILKQQPAVILLDIRLANDSSNTLCLAVKSNPATKHIPVILVSAHENLQLLAKDCNADAFLAKPFDLKDMIQLVEHYSDRYNSAY